MTTKLFILSALAIVSIVGARVARDAPAQDVFGDLFDSFKNFLDERNQDLLKAVGVENNDQLQEKVLDKGKAVANDLDIWAREMKIKTETFKDHELVKSLRETIDKNIEDFKLKNPGTAADIQAYVEKVNQGRDEIVSKIKGLQDSKEAKEIQDLAKKLGEASVTAFENIKKESENILKH